MQVVMDLTPKVTSIAGEDVTAGRLGRGKEIHFRDPAEIGVLNFDALYADVVEHKMLRGYDIDGEAPLPRLHIDRSLCNPLLLNPADFNLEDVSVSPPGLGKNEREFVWELRRFWDAHHNREPYRHYEMFLLRNIPKVGVGFFFHSGFYPDFILWARDQRSVLIFNDLRSLKALESRLTRLQSKIPQTTATGRLVGDSPPMQEVRERIRLAAEFNATILILGETGTGKELVAEEIHERSARARGPLVKLSCAALPETLLESELFGHAKGAFTGAAKDKPGRFEMAHRGTLMLDEIGDLSPLMQVKLLRVLQHHEFERLGESKTRSTDVRIIAATHRDLRRLVEAGQFREDFFYRLNVFPIHLPPLRERGTDVLLLAQHFMDHFNRETGKPIQELSPDVRRILLDFCWPGNVRQLENAIEHAFVTCPGAQIGLFDLPVEIRLTHLREQLCRKSATAGAGIYVSPSRETRIEPPPREELERVLTACGQNRAEAARPVVSPGRNRD